MCPWEPRWALAPEGGCNARGRDRQPFVALEVPGDALGSEGELPAEAEDLRDERGPVLVRKGPFRAPLSRQESLLATGVVRLAPDVEGVARDPEEATGLGDVPRESSMGEDSKASAEFAAGLGRSDCLPAGHATPACQTNPRLS